VFSHNTGISNFEMIPWKNIDSLIPLPQKILNSFTEDHDVNVYNISISSSPTVTFSRLELNDDIVHIFQWCKRYNNWDMLYSPLNTCCMDADKVGHTYSWVIIYSWDLLYWMYFVYKLGYIKLYTHIYSELWDRFSI